jgi:vanillate O-demethylase ferredoxin subunit
VRLTNISYLASGINAYELRPLDGAPVPVFKAGSHIDLHLSNGLVRQYSLLNDEHDRNHFSIAVKRDQGGRGGSVYIHDELRAGSVLEVGGPRNNFPVAEGAPISVFIAGGIGITPIFCMIKRLASLGSPWQLYYSVTRRAELALIETLEQNAVNVHVDEENNGRLLDVPSIVTNAPVGAHLYCCGPSRMLDIFEEAALRTHSAENVHIERFGQVIDPSSNGGFIVELARSGRRIHVARGRTVLQALREAGVMVKASCEQGVCGTCETRVLSGIPDHRDTLLSTEEQAANNAMMICCSGSKSEVLVLDL